MDLKYRERQVLQLLLSKKSITGHELSDHFKISDRTVRNDIKKINAFLDEFSIEISSNTNTGYFLPITHEDRVHLNDVLRSRLTISSGEPAYREKYILYKLLRENRLDIYDLAEELFISTSSVLADLKKIEKKLSAMDSCFILSKKGNIYYLGNICEKDIRLYFSMILISQFDNIDIRILSEIVDVELPFKKLKCSIVSGLNENGVVLSNHDLMFFCTYLAISVVRDQHGYKIPKNSKKYFEMTAFPITDEIYDEISKTLQITFSEEEVQVINELFASFNTLQQSSRVNINHRKIIRSISHEIDQVYGTEFRKDDQFLNGLTTHLDSYINKKQLHIDFAEGIINEIRQLYPFAYNLATYLVDLLKKDVVYETSDISEKELAFISIHIQASIERHTMNRKINALVVSAYGIGTTKLLETQLTKEFPNIHILTTISPFAYEAMNPNYVELIITTTPLIRDMDTPIVEVEVPLRRRSIESIQDILKSKYYWMKEVHPFILDIPLELKSETDCIEYMANVVDNIEENTAPIKRKILEREQILSTYLGKQVAMPHALFDEAFHYNLYFFRHANGVTWGSSKVKFIALILITSQIKGFMNEYMKLINHIYSNIDVDTLPSMSVLNLVESMQLE